MLAVAYILFYIHLAPISNVIVVGFDGFRGLNLLGSANDILKILTSGAVLVVLNAVLAATLAIRVRLLAGIVAFVSLAVSILILISVGAIIAVN